MDLVDEQVVEKFAAFERQQEPLLVQEALLVLQVAQQDLPIGEVTARKRGFSRWLRFLALLERYIDPNWNSEEVPEMALIPPPSNGVVYPSGVDPSVIPDPVARLQYSQAIEANNNYANWYSAQLKLRRIDSEAMTAIKWWLTERYTGSPTDRQEVEELLTVSSVSNMRKELLRSLVPKAQRMD